MSTNTHSLVEVVKIFKRHYIWLRILTVYIFKKSFHLTFTHPCIVTSNIAVFIVYSSKWTQIELKSSRKFLVWFPHIFYSLHSSMGIMELMDGQIIWIVAGDEAFMCDSFLIIKHKCTILIKLEK
jgi:hypothetical protein